MVPHQQPQHCLQLWQLPALQLLVVAALAELQLLAVAVTRAVWQVLEGTQRQLAPHQTFIGQVGAKHQFTTSNCWTF